MSSFFVDDHCALKENNKIRGIIAETWRDIDSAPSMHSEDWIFHDGLSPAIESQLLDGLLPLGHVHVNFMEPYSGSALVREELLILLDRSFSVGDVAKRQLSDVESGTITSTAMECTLQPLYRYTGDKNPWPHKEEENLLFNIPGEELRYIEDLAEDSYIIYKDWVGWIRELFQEVTIRLGDGSIVVVQSAEDLEIYKPKSSREQDIPPSRNLSEILIHRLNAGQSDKTTSPTVFYPGQIVTTQKANLRLGRWKSGYYKPSVNPKGVIVEVRDIQVIVRWMTQNVFDPVKAQSEMPSTVLTIDEIDSGEIIVYGSKKLSSTNHKTCGAVIGSDIEVGDFVRFRDLPGASVKYAEQSLECAGGRQGTLHRIPRKATMGYDMNVFMVRETRLKTTIQWQDGSTSEQMATSLVPYLNVDDHDVWPGEIVALRGNESDGSVSLDKIQSGDAQDFIKPESVGVVQSTDAKERIARVRWFEQPRISIFDEQRSVLLPGSTLGHLSNRETEVSYYEMVAYPALTKRRGDLVLIAPTSELLALHTTHALQLSASNDFTIPATLHAMFGNGMGGFVSEGMANIRERLYGSSNNRSEIDWFGEIVDLGLDGLLTVRLGALDDVRDIRVPVERIIVVPGADGVTESGSLNSGEEQDSYGYAESDSGDDYDSEDIIEETVEYEGGMRLDNDSDDEMWMTDEDNESPLGAPPKDRTLKPMDIAIDEVLDTASSLPEPMETSTDSAIDQEARAKDGTDVVFSETAISPVLPETLFSSCSHIPQQFQILDQPPPPDHHFFNDPVQMSAFLLRRIRKEYRILETSLPDGVWIRSWMDRLDILRVLILGPRDTPYSEAPFVIDFQFGHNFPNSPPEAYFHSWTNGMGRINPNLYEDGKICLSLLGTWPGDSKDEGWSSPRSSMLQVVVSLMALVLNNAPYFNEAGFDALIGSEESLVNSALYSERAFVMARGFVAYVTLHEIAGLEDVIEWLYRKTATGPNLFQKIADECRNILDVGQVGTESSLVSSNDQRQGKLVAAAGGKTHLSSGARILLRRHISTIEKYCNTENK